MTWVEIDQNDDPTQGVCFIKGGLSRLSFVNLKQDICYGFNLGSFVTIECNLKYEEAQSSYAHSLQQSSEFVCVECLVDELFNIK